MEKKQIEAQVVKLFAELISSETDPNGLAESLDEVLWRYTMYLVDDPASNGFLGRSDGLYYLRRLRNICQGKAD